MGEIPLSAVFRYGAGASSEGVLVDREGSLFGCGRDGTLYKVDPTGKTSVLARIEGGSANGVAMDRAGNLVYCDVAKHALIRVTQGGAVSLLADHIAGVALRLPNFAAFDAEGDLYVSNSSHRNREDMLPEFIRPEPNGSLLRLRKDGREDLVASGLYLANGVAVDPKEEAVYVLQSLKRDCLRIPRRMDGTHGAPEIFAADFPGMPDGMAFDRDGNLFVTLCSAAPDARGKRAEMNRVLKVDTSGRWSVLLDDPAGEILHHPTNCAFGGEDLRDLYIASHSTPYYGRVRTAYRGHPLYHQR